MSKAFRAMLLVAVAATPATAAEPRKPTARWVVNYDDAQCVASRNYGTADRPLFLALKPSPTGSVMRVMLIRNGAAIDAEQRRAIIRFDSSQPIVANALAYGDRRLRRVIASINLPMQTFAAHHRATSVEVKAGAFDERLSVPGLAGVIAAFDDCLANLRTVWNVGEAYSSRVATPARPVKPLRELFRSSDYPEQAINQYDTGRVGISMLIDETGKVKDCMVEETSGFATLDTMSCFLITTEAKFEPALGPDGKPVKSATLQRINWQIAP